MPKRFEHPGVFIEEVYGRVNEIAGVATSIATFVGRAAKGPMGKAVLCLSYADFVEKFGGAHPQSELADSVRLFFENGGSVCYVVRVSLNAFRSKASLTDQGLNALEKVDIFNLMVLPRDSGITEPRHRSLLAAAGKYCQKRSAFLLIDAPESWKSGVTPDAIDDFCAGMVKNSSAVFYPRIVVNDAGVSKTTGASGAVAGLIARTDSCNGIWKFPAGSDAKLRGAKDIERNLTAGEIDRLNKLGINCLRRLPDMIVNWGARTLDGAEGSISEWKYVNVRRMFTYFDRSIDRGTQWAVFEHNDELLWVKLRSSIELFLTHLWRRGALQGRTPKEAFYVRCGLGDTMTQNDLDAGRLIIQVGIAPLKPAEFIDLRFYHKSS
jgi:phage tail sheath protein FI